MLLLLMMMMLATGDVVDVHGFVDEPAAGSKLIKCFDPPIIKGGLEGVEGVEGAVGPEGEEGVEQLAMFWIDSLFIEYAVMK